MLVGQPGARQQHAQVQVALLVAHQQQQAAGLVALVVIGDPHVGADDRLDALAARFLVEAHQAESVGKVGQRQRAHAIGGGGLDGLVQADVAVDDGIFGMETEMDEARRIHPRIVPGGSRRKTGAACANAHPPPRHPAWAAIISAYESTGYPGASNRRGSTCRSSTFPLTNSSPSTTARRCARPCSPNARHAT